jgi:hypothetical protein
VGRAEKNEVWKGYERNTGQRREGDKGTKDIKETKKERNEDRTNK